MPPRNVGQACSPLRIVVQTRQIAKLPAAFGQKGVATLHLDFLKCFQAIGQKTRAHDIDLAYSLPRPFTQRRFSVGLQPFLGTEAALKRYMKQVGVVAQPLPEQSCGFHAVAIVGIALLDRATRQAMKTKQKQIGRAHVWTPVTNAHLVCSLLLEKKKNK